MLRDLEHPAVSEMNQKGFIGLLDQSECMGIDYFGDEILSGDDVAIDGNETILKDNLEKYLFEVYDIRFQTVE